ncbi:hypothetical protein [Clostridium sp. 'White wine YQ']|uniref:hypothetical protein n=1 Tax=Clostridium sp. 'White wine YQ' TaxID=3027474 RepID=UPI002365474A|nr:hypothetical protein [Clostridium sp. 'White wine YQ']MDD7792902.1 hypothetical protein [Clostridium sp. 'White wine YQ']
MKNKLILILLILLLSLIPVTVMINYKKENEAINNEETQEIFWPFENIEKRNKVLNEENEFNYKEILEQKRTLKEGIDKAWEQKLNNRSKSRELLNKYINDVAEKVKKGLLSNNDAKNQIDKTKKEEEEYWENSSKYIEASLKEIESKMDLKQKEIDVLKGELDTLIDIGKEQEVEIKAKEYIKALKDENELLSNKEYVIKKGGELPTIFN